MTRSWKNPSLGENYDVGLVCALEWSIDWLVLEVGGLEPEVVEKIFVELRRFGWVVSQPRETTGQRPCSRCSRCDPADETAARDPTRA